MTTALSTGIRRAAARIAPDPAPDGELLSRFLAARDEAAFAVLVRRHAAMVFGTCRRVLGNAADADDAFQAAFVVLVRKAHSLTDRACVGNFLYGVAFHTALKARAMATKRKAKEARVEIPQPTSTDSELTIILDEELAKLPEKYREPVVLCELEGVSRRDAAGRLGVPEGTISSRLATAHRMLEKRLKARGFAAVAIAAVLGNQALAASGAVSDSLANAAVRAATSGAPAGITHLAAEVTKMFLLTKLKVGTAVLAGVVLLLAAGVGFVQRGTAADDKREVKAAPVNPDRKGGGVQKDEDAIQGLWQAESLEQGGQKAPDEAVKTLQIRFKGTSITFLPDDRTHTFELDPKAKPKAMNVTLGDGDDKGKKAECGIYELDGDTLKLCIDSGAGTTRPTEFKTTAADKFQLFVLKRVKEEKKDEDAIQGLWQAETVQVRGKQVPAAQVYKVLRMRFQGNVLTTITEDGEGRSVFALEATTSPRKIATHPEGKPKEKKDYAIYDLDGDTLKLCHNTDEGDAGPLPTSFRAGPQDKDELIVFKRVTDAAEAIQGTWIVNELHQVGKKMTDEEKTFYAGGGYKITFTADTMTHEIDKSTAKYRLDPTRDEKRIEIIENGAVVALAVYDLNGDTLKLCVGRKPDRGMPPVAPTGFDVEKEPAGTFPTAYVMKRDKPKAKPADDAKKLVGKWVTKAVTFDPPFPVAAGDKHTPAHHTLTFTDTELTWLTFVPGMPKAGGVQAKPYKLDPAKSPKELTSGDNECVYELDGDTLKLAMYFLTPGRPKGFTAADSPPKAGGHVILIELTREKDDKANPDRKGGGADDKEYSLAAGEVLKLIPAPFPAGRDKVYDRIPASKRTGGPADTNLLAVAVGDGADEVSEFAARRWKDGDPVKPPQLLHSVKHLLKIDTATVADPNWLLESTVLDADVVFRKTAKPEELLAALSRELKAKCGVSVTFTTREIETDVVVLSGKHALTRKHAFPGRPYNDAARVALTDKPLAGSAGRGTAQLPAELATFIGRPVVDESDLKTNDVAVWITTPSYDTRPQAADRDPAAVLKRFADQTGLTAKLEKRKVRAVVIEDSKKPAEPAWKAEFRKAYGLTDGQLVRRIAPPYPDCRDQYFRDLFRSNKGGPRAISFDQWFTVIGWKNDFADPLGGPAVTPVKPEEGVALVRLLDMTLQFPPTRIESDLTTLERKATGDFVVRAGADPEKVAVQLEAILRKELELPVKFTFRDAEEEVFVLSGKYAAKPVDGSQVDVEVYANHLTERGVGGGGTGTLTEMLAAVERHVGKPVVLGKVEGGPAKVSWHYNVRSPMLRDPAKGIDTYRDDTNPAQVLGRLADQTGLTLSTEKRKVRLLVVEHAEVKK